MKVPELVRVCECGTVATGFAAARCGRDGRHNIRASCPTKQIRIVAWQVAEEEQGPQAPEPRFPDPFEGARPIGSGRIGTRQEENPDASA
jgi:hypothetical protein